VFFLNSSASHSNIVVLETILGLSLNHLKMNRYQGNAGDLRQFGLFA
jgi:hypothetical protein